MSCSGGKLENFIELHGSSKELGSSKNCIHTLRKLMEVHAIFKLQEIKEGALEFGTLDYRQSIRTCRAASSELKIW